MVDKSEYAYHQHTCSIFKSVIHNAVHTCVHVNVDVCILNNQYCTVINTNIIKLMLTATHNDNNNKVLELLLKQFLTSKTAIITAPSVTCAMCMLHPIKFNML